MSSLTGLPDTFSPWLSNQRWFASKGRSPELRRIGGWELRGDGVRIRTHLVMDHSGSEPTLYQVPITERREHLIGIDNALIGTMQGDDGATLYVYDGAYDPAYRDALLRQIITGAAALPDGADATGTPFADYTAFEILQSSVLTGEQSNTSVVYRLAAHEDTLDIICKVFRALHHGDNPDVVVQSALAAAGSTHVPAPIGAVVGEWDDVGRAEGRARGHLAAAQQFLPGSEDGWRGALREAGAGRDFTARAYALGSVTAEIHTILADVMPSGEPTPDDVDSTLDSFRRRLDLAVDEVPAIAPFREPIERLYQAAREAQWPRMQRIHGDYHLGQVLATAAGDWVVLDFEGEPLRPMEERTRPDFAVRDVAGMLRSFDYVAGSLGGTEAAEEWARDNRRAFLDGYIDRSGVNLRENRTLLDAFEVDKAIYEAVYEARNRPDWVAIPTAALKRLAERTSSSLG